MGNPPSGGLRENHRSIGIMEYRNKITGQIISVSAPIEGGFWEPVEETEEPAEETSKKAPARKTTRTKK